MKIKKILQIKFFLICNLVLFYSNSYALTQQQQPEFTVLVSGLGKEGDKFPTELTRFWEIISIPQDDNKTMELAPTIKLIRIDLADEKNLILPSTDTWVDNLVKPDPRISLKKHHDYLENSKITRDFSKELASEEGQKEARVVTYSTEITTIYEVLSGEVTEKNQFTTVVDLFVNLKKQIVLDSSNGSSLKYLVIYRLDSPSEVVVQPKTVHSEQKNKAILTTVPKVQATKQVSILAEKKEEIPLESKQHVKQGMIYVSMAKQNKSTHAENIKNALTEFDMAVKAEEEKGRCYASAIMNRGIAYWSDKKLNLAEKDLLKASECDSKDPIIFYNLMSYYSSVNKADLAIEPLNKALDLGFKDCDILRSDADLKNLRKLEDFKRSLEQHSLFCLK
jgi:hypothetical protein